MRAIRKLLEKQLHAGKNTHNSGIKRYNDPDSTKNNEQLRRYQHITLQIQISENTTVYSSQKPLFGNVQNKKQLIILLSTILKKITSQ